MAEWQNGRMAEWQNGIWQKTIPEWQNGNSRIAEWQINTLVCIVMSNTIVILISQIQNIPQFHTLSIMTKSTSVAVKSAVTTTKRSPRKGKDASKGPYPYRPSPKKTADEKKNSHNINPLVDTNGTPYGWALKLL